VSVQWASTHEETFERVGMEITPALVAAFFTGLAALVGAIAGFVRLSNEESRLKQTLRALWLWVEGEGYTKDVPPTLRGMVDGQIDTAPGEGSE
jgi:hypothetical protein